MSLGVSCLVLGCFVSKGCQGHCYVPSGPCITRPELCLLSLQKVKHAPCGHDLTRLCYVIFSVCDFHLGMSVTDKWLPARSSDKNCCFFSLKGVSRGGFGIYVGHILEASFGGFTGVTNCDETPGVK